MSCNKVSYRIQLLIFLNFDFRAHAARLKALEKGEIIQANCKSSTEEKNDDDSGDASEEGSTACDASNEDCGKVTIEFNQCTIRLVA